MPACSRRRLTALVLAGCAGTLLTAACGLSIEGSLEPDGGSPGGGDPGEGGALSDAPDDASAAEGGTTPDGSDTKDSSTNDAGSLCIAAAPGLIGWWTGDTDMTDRAGAHNGVSGTQAGATAVGYGSGKVAGAFDLAGKSYVQIANVGVLQLNAAFTMEAWIYPTTLGGRIVDKITAGGSDGYLLDTNQSKLRMIVGPSALSSPAVLPLATWSHVAGTWDGTTAQLHVNGVAVATATITGLIQKNGLTLRLGADSTGNNRFDGKLDEVGLYGRALSAAEISAIFAAGPNGRCK